MKKLLLVLFLFCLNVANGQNITIRKEYYDYFNTKIKLEYGVLPDGKKHGSFKFYSTDGTLLCLDTYNNGDLQNSKVLFADGSVQYETNWGKDKYGKTIRKGAVKGYKLYDGKRFMSVDAIAEDDDFLQFKIYSKPNVLFREYSKALNEYKEYENGKVTYRLLLKDGILTMTTPNGEVVNNTIKSFSGNIWTSANHYYKTEVMPVEGGRIKLVEKDDRMYTEGVFIPLQVNQTFSFSIDKEILLSKTFNSISIPQDAYISVRTPDGSGKDYNRLFELFILSLDKLDGDYIKKENGKVVKEGRYANGIPIQYVQYDANGRLVAECKDGQEKFYDVKTGKVVSSAYYEGGYRIRTGYNEAGEKKWVSKETITTNPNEKPIVVSVGEYYPNGNLKNESIATDSVKIGFKVYYNLSINKDYAETGKITREYYQTASTEKDLVPRGDGSYREVNKQILLKETKYKDGNKAEEMEVFYNGQRVGINFREMQKTTAYDHDGNVYSIQYYSNDAPGINDKYIYDVRGKVIKNNRLDQEYEEDVSLSAQIAELNTISRHKLEAKLANFKLTVNGEKLIFNNHGQPVLKKAPKELNQSLSHLYEEFLREDVQRLESIKEYDLSIKNVGENTQSKIEIVREKDYVQKTRAIEISRFTKLVDKYISLASTPRDPMIKQLTNLGLDEVYELWSIK